MRLSTQCIYNLTPPCCSALAAARHRRHRRQRHLEQARLLQQLLAPEPGPPHRVGARERAPSAAGGGGAEDVGRAVEEVEDVLDGGHAGEGRAGGGGAAVAAAAAATSDALAHGRLGRGASFFLERPRRNGGTNSIHPFSNTAEFGFFVLAPLCAPRQRQMPESSEIQD